MPFDAVSIVRLTDESTWHTVTQVKLSIHIDPDLVRCVRIESAHRGATMSALVQASIIAWLDDKSNDASLPALISIAGSRIWLRDVSVT